MGLKRGENSEELLGYRGLEARWQGPGEAAGLHQVMSPKPAPAKMEPMMQRRKATQKELDQGQREIEAAQRRLDQQVEEVAIEDGKAEGDPKEAETPMSHEEHMERAKALTEGLQSSSAAPPEDVRPLENATEEPGATKKAKVADRLEGSLIAAQLGSSFGSKAV